MVKLGHQKTKIFVVNQFYPPDYAPTGQLIYELVNQLGNRGYLTRVFTGQPGYAYHQKLASPLERQNNQVIKRTRATALWKNRIRGKAVNGVLFFVRGLLHLVRHLRRRDVLLLTTAPPFLPFMGYLLHRLTGAAYVCLVYDLYPDVAENLGVVSSNHWIVKFWNQVNRHTWNKAKKIIVLSQTMKKQIIGKHPHLAPKIQIISNWADPNWIVPRDKQQNWFARKYQLTDKFTVLYSGNMGRCHDLDTILQAARELKDEPFQFVFIGSGAKYQTSLDTVQQWGLDNCLFLPYQDREVLPFSLTACDLSLVSVDKGMGGVVAPSKLYSVLATGRPLAVICDSQCFLRDTIQKIKCGVSFANGDGQGLAQFIRQMASNPQLAKSMGEAGREYLVSHCTLETIVEQYVSALGMPVQNPHSEISPNSNMPVPVDVTKTGSMLE
jgi:glycosyltransferase involved in cell wall biosynthesis